MIDNEERMDEDEDEEQLGEEYVDEDGDNTLILTDEDGSEIECDLLAEIAYKGATYVVLLPREDNSNQALILLSEEADDGTNDIIYSTVEDDEILDAVFEIFKNSDEAQELYDFV